MLRVNIFALLGTCGGMPVIPVQQQVTQEEVLQILPLEDAD